MKASCLSPRQKFAKILNQGPSNQCSFCVYMPVTRVLRASHVYITAWEYCFFTVHLVKAFGDASVLWTQGNKVSRLFYIYKVARLYEP